MHLFTHFFVILEPSSKNKFHDRKPHSSITRAMDLAKTLIRSVVRAFYDTPFILVIDALMVHSAFVAAYQR